MNARERTMNRMLASVVKDLNYYADLEAAGESVPGHTPSNPHYWFSGLARDAGVRTWPDELKANLSADAKAML